VIENTSSTDIRKGLSISRTGLGDLAVDRVHQLADGLDALGLAFQGRRGGAADDDGGLAVKIGTW